ncbi:Transcriptional regulator of yeast form adherence 3 [Galdieria sulphuraria]|uniref:RING-type domain-containing protein n=1 Tax=Galdieria sulphuraria TaxID=130081 RepID=M2W5U9_GALSU|nr:uncharacterized protein Gasu_16460 [Galdieria sulphuraria]EME31151.1 hypothetical protein Gasu_16460 [Galdieria sulphuraria]GJD12379.1 Transcriptional regulator of yeast form adherence 3 [Galdieria sulphuraria]|eukprot:XP_005707671.1 hypothetical protein Gasu_16460 [Galdieria sulphuraria]
MKFAHQLDRIVAESDEDYAKQYVSYRNLKKDLRRKNRHLKKLFSQQSFVTEGDLSNSSVVPFPTKGKVESSKILENNGRHFMSPFHMATEVNSELTTNHSQERFSGPEKALSSQVSGDVTEDNIEEIIRDQKKNILAEEEFATNIVYIDPKDAAFFHHLDEELEKVNRFFLPRAKALLERYEYLEKQESKLKLFSSFKTLKEKLFPIRTQKVKEASEGRLESSSNSKSSNGFDCARNSSNAESTSFGSSSTSLNRNEKDNFAYIDKLNSTVEVYKEALRLLQYVNVNITAFRKILKKHDKLCELSVGKQYLRLKVESQPFVHSALAKTLEELGYRGSIIVSLVRKRPSELSNMEEYHCPICLSLLYKPMALPCGHRFCGKCISRAILLDFHCPVCRHDYSSGVRLERKKSLERFLRESFPDAWQKRKEEVLQDEKDRERILANTQQNNRPRATLFDPRHDTNNHDREYLDTCRVS